MKNKIYLGGAWGEDFYSSTSFSSHFNSTCTWTCICSLNHYDTRATCFLQSPNFKSSAQWWRDDTCDFALWIGSLEQFNPLALFDHVLPEHFLFTFFFKSQLHQNGATLGDFYGIWNVNTHKKWGLDSRWPRGHKKIITFVLFCWKWPTIGNEWEIDKHTKIQHIFVCTIYKSATMQKKHTARGGKSTKIFYSSKSTITLLKFYLSTSKSTSLKIYSSKSKK